MKHVSEPGKGCALEGHVILRILLEALESLKAPESIAPTSTCTGRSPKAMLVQEHLENVLYGIFVVHFSVGCLLG